MAAARPILIAWTFALTVVFVAAFVLFDDAARGDKHDFANIDTAFLGSSLTRHAVPTPENAPPLLLEQTGAYVRFGLSAAKPKEIEDLYEQAVKAQVATIVLELRPFLYLTRNNPPLNECHEIRCRSSQVLNTVSGDIFELRRQFRLWYRKAAGLPPPVERFQMAKGEPDTLGKVMDPNERLDHRYPLTLLLMRDNSRLFDLTRRAQAQGSKVIFVVPPRSPLANGLIPAEQHRALAAQARALSGDMDVPLFGPGNDWRNTDFHDGAHLNQAGRDRFVSDIARWLADRP